MANNDSNQNYAARFLSNGRFSNVDIDIEQVCEHEDCDNAAHHAINFRGMGITCGFCNQHCWANGSCVGPVLVDEVNRLNAALIQTEQSVAEAFVKNQELAAKYNDLLALFHDWHEAKTQCTVPQCATSSCTNTALNYQFLAVETDLPECWDLDFCHVCNHTKLTPQPPSKSVFETFRCATVEVARRPLTGAVVCVCLAVLFKLSTQ